ncbi:unnamed protein product [Brassicogethes aeneus]|uniref:Uncharacterized protein n=1 Tax=Brassicogethes aeneus TaxID=1431903 RepID=A0A9P0FDF7_BRAAE|nr:unnamed protein product [Brassicogethes aeneus]
MSSTNDKKLDPNENIDLEFGRFLSHPEPGEEVCITGMSGSFPDCENVDELKEKLFNKVDLITDAGLRWATTNEEIPKRTGKMKVVDKFDPGFFGISAQQAKYMCVMVRMCLEKVIEAICDAGINPKDLEGTRTGVFIGTTNSETEELWFFERVETATALTGVLRSMMTTRISYFLKLQAHSMVLDTACSSSMMAMDNAFKAIRQGKCDAAIVCGAAADLHPNVNLQFARLGVLSKDGSCKVFDKDADGYARSEAIACVFLQRSKDAKRIYATVVHSKTNSDGYKEHGITFPSKEGQKTLLKEFYNECEVDPNDLSYFEAHGTGTKVGDPEELSATDEVFAERRTKPLMIGSVKSNMGHTEPTSGLCSVIKSIIGLESGYIPPNINFKEHRDDVPAFKEGRFKVVTEKTPFEDDNGLIGISNFGFGGANGHVLIKWHSKVKKDVSLKPEDLPRLICVSSRLTEGVETFFNNAKSNQDTEYIALLHNLFEREIKNHTHRGYSLISNNGEFIRSTRHVGNPRQLNLIFGGYESSWRNVGQEFLGVEVYQNAINQIQNILLSFKINVHHLIENPSNAVFDNVLGSILVKLALTEVLKALKVEASGYIGHSLGEIVAAYYDDCLTLEQAVLIAFTISKYVENINQSAASYMVNLDVEQLNKILPQRVYVEAINSKNSVIISGHPESVKNFVGKLVAHNIQVKDLGANIIDFHGDNFLRLKPHIIQDLFKVLPQPKLFSNKHILKSNTKASAEFFVNSLTSTTSLKDLACNIEVKSAIFEIGQGYLQSSVDEATENYTLSVNIENFNQSYFVGFLKALGSLYEVGSNFSISKLYSQVQFPVSRGTSSISPAIRWNHSQEWETANFRNVGHKENSRAKIFEVIFGKDCIWNFAHGHVIDGRNLFPATGYLNIVWETLRWCFGYELAQNSVIFTNCKFLRAVNCVKEGVVELTVMIQKGTGDFEIAEGGQPVVTGNIQFDNKVKNEQLTLQTASVDDEKVLPLKTKDIYKELRLRGYNYSGLFRGLEEVNGEVTKGKIKWQNNWVAFMDNLLQMKILEFDSRLLYVPTQIKRLTINPKHHLDLIQANGTMEESHLDAYVCPHSGVIRSGGIQVEGLSASAIPRRKPLGEPVLEKYEFVSNAANLTIENSTRVNMQIVLENKFEIKVKVVELIDEDTMEDSLPLGPLIFDVLGDQPVIQAEVTVLSKTPLELKNVTVEDNKLKSQTDCLVVVLSNALSNPERLETAFKSLKENGFIISREKADCSYADSNENVQILTTHNTKTEKLYLLRKPEQFKRVTPINIENVKEDFNWVQTLQQSVGKEESVLVYALNEPQSGLLGMVNCLRREPGGNTIRCIQTFEETPSFDQYNPFYYEQLKKNLAVNVYKNGTWGTYRHLALEENPQVLTEHRYVNISTRGDLSSLKWFEGHLSAKYEMPPEKTLVFTYYAALNFRDVMTATGKITPDVITKYRPEQENVQGFEFAGRTESGRRVIGLLTNGAFSTINMADTYLLFDIPDYWTMEEAATVPCVYLTVIYGLFSRAGMKKGDKILIHSGTGGVGQAAIQLALHFGCQVFTTVGTQEKRDFIKKKFPQLTDNRIGNSRDTSFETLIMQETKGEGVDLVLNSLAEEKLQASVRCLGFGGKFVEIGKFDLANDNRLKLLDFAKEQSFHGVMLDSIFAESPSTKKKVCVLFEQCMKNGAIKPLNRTIFKDDELEKAFRHMTTGKHMGKVLVQLRKEEPEKVFKPIVSLHKAVPRYFCDPNFSYIITGGLGGFGLELADWLVLRGVRKIVLTSRTGVRTGYQSMRIKIWKSYGALVNVNTDDITTKEGCEKLLKSANELGPVKAIFNLAVVLKDSIFENQSVESFRESYKPKALATKYLDELSRELCPNLKDFVIFSSVSCGRGNAGQTNYGYSNSVMERICEKRKSEGLPALAIEWGAIGEVGLVADMQEENTEIEIGGTLQQRISSCLQVMDKLLRCPEPIVSSMVVAEKKSGSGGADNIIDAVAYILGIKDMKAISYHSTLAELGMDSMTAVEIKQTLEREFDVFLTAQDIRSMTFSRLQEIQDEKSSPGDSPVTSKELKEQDFNFIDQLFTLMGEEGVVNIPLVKLNSKLSEENPGPKILLYPGIEGIAEILNNLTLNLNAHCAAVQYCPQNHGNTIKELAESTLPHVESYFNKSEPFIIIAHSFGAPVALETVKMLEEKGYNGSVFCIDGSPAYLKTLSFLLQADNKTSWQKQLMLHFLLQVTTKDVVEKHKEKIMAAETFEDMIKALENVVNIQKVHSIAHIKSMLDGSFKRVYAMNTYELKPMSLKSKVTLIKPTIQSVIGLKEDYGFSEFLGKEIEVNVFKSDHLSILSNSDVAKYINNHVCTDATFIKESIFNASEITNVRSEATI